YRDEAVPSYETALREGAGGGVGLASGSGSGTGQGPSSTVTPVHPSPSRCSYGCSPYSANGTARIVILPAPHMQHFHSQASGSQQQPLLPAPASMQQPVGPRAKPRFFIALMHAVFIYILINVLVDYIAT
ncbi:hypothetical protein BCV70DRAFT_153112, partial [Testicularia cyperi]